MQALDDNVQFVSQVDVARVEVGLWYACGESRGRRLGEIVRDELPSRGVSSCTRVTT